jgi:hypothetical protein
MKYLVYWVLSIAFAMTAVIWLLTFCVVIFSMIRLYELRKTKAKSNAKIVGAPQIVEKIIARYLFVLATSALYHKPACDICKVCHPFSPQHLVSFS